MKKVFRNSDQLQCIFTDEGVTFYGTKQDVYAPYGSMDSIKLSLLGILQATCHTQIFSFTVDRKDRAEMKEMVKYAAEAIKTAPKAEVQMIDLTKKQEKDQVSEDLSPEEQLKKYKTLFIQGAISKEEYDAQKRRLKN